MQLGDATKAVPGQWLRHMIRMIHDVSAVRAQTAGSNRAPDTCARLGPSDTASRAAGFSRMLRAT